MNLLEHGSATWVLIIARLGGFMGTFPLFRAGMVPRSVKAAFTVALGSLWFSNFATSSDVALPAVLSNHPAGYLIALARESMIGALIGFLIGLFFIPAQIAGSYLGQEMGFHMAGITDPSTGANSNVFGDFLAAMATLTFFLVDSHHLAFGAIYWSFVRLPLATPLPSLRPEMFSQSFADAHRWGLELAAPIGTGLFLTTVVVALLMKISPQLNLFAVGIPFRLLFGLAISLVFFPDIIQLMETLFTEKVRYLFHSGF